MNLRPPTMAELVPLIRAETDPARRAQLEEWYWGLATERHGPRTAWYRGEYEWLKRHWPKPFTTETVL